MILIHTEWLQISNAPLKQNYSFQFEIVFKSLATLIHNLE